MRKCLIGANFLVSLIIVGFMSVPIILEAQSSSPKARKASASRAMVLCISKSNNIQVKSKCGRNETSVTAAMLMGQSPRSGFVDISEQPQDDGKIGSSPGNGFSPAATSTPVRTIIAGPTLPPPNSNTPSSPGITTPVGTVNPQSTPTPQTSSPLTFFDDCYTKDVTVASGPGVQKTITMNCDNTGSEFMSARSVKTTRAAGTGLIVQQFEEMNLDDGIPVGTMVQFVNIDQTATNWSIQGSISCCSR